MIQILFSHQSSVYFFINHSSPIISPIVIKPIVPSFEECIITLPRITFINKILCFRKVPIMQRESARNTGINGVKSIVLGVKASISSLNLYFCYLN